MALGQIRTSLFSASVFIQTFQQIRHRGFLRMNKMPCKEIKSMTKAEVKAFIDSFDVVMTDCDGVLWKESNVIDGANEVIQEFRKLNKRIFFCTNNSTKSRDQYVQKCHDLGFGGVKEEMIGTSFLSAHYLKSIGFKGRIYVIGGEGITNELDAFGIPYVPVGPDPVPEDWTYDDAKALMETLPDDVNGVICGNDKHFSYFKLLKAASILSRPNSVFIGTNIDQQFPAGDGLVIPGTGCFVEAVAVAAAREATLMGKPETMTFDVVKSVHPEVDPARTLMIGDRANTDILLGKNCNLKTLMVGSGVHSLNDIRKWESSGDPELERLCADYFIPKLGDLREALLS